MNNYIQEGRVLTITAAADTSGGDVVITGQIVGIAAGDAKTGEKLDVVTEGVFRLGKVAADNITLGAAVYYDAGDGLITIDSDTGNNAKVGVAVEAAAATTGTVAVRLSGF